MLPLLGSFVPVYVLPWHFSNISFFCDSCIMHIAVSHLVCINFGVHIIMPFLISVCIRVASDLVFHLHVRNVRI